MCDSAKAVVREIESGKCLYQKRFQISDLSFHLKKLEEEEQMKIKIKQEKGNNKDQSRNGKQKLQKHE